MTLNGTTTEVAGVPLFGRALISEEEVVGSEWLGCQLTLRRAACRGLVRTWGCPGSLGTAALAAGQAQSGSALPLRSAAFLTDGCRVSLVTAINYYQQLRILGCKLVSMWEGGCQQG